MKRTFIFVVLLACSLTAYSQSEPTFQQKLEEIFAPLDKSYMTTHILRNQTLVTISDDSTYGINNKIYSYDSLDSAYFLHYVVA